MYVAILVYAAFLQTALFSSAQAPGPPNPGRGSYSDADQAAPLPSAAGKPVLSPPASASIRLNGKKLSVHYSSPAMRGRRIMGELVPYGKVWRTGADAATSFSTAADLMIGSLRVPAGSYTLYTLPAAPGSGEPWRLIINQQVGQWGLVYDASRDLARVPMQAAPVASPQQSMTISFKKGDGAPVELHVKWESVDEFVRITPAP